MYAVLQKSRSSTMSQTNVKCTVIKILLFYPHTIKSKRDISETDRGPQKTNLTDLTKQRKNRLDRKLTKNVCNTFIFSRNCDGLGMYVKKIYKSTSKSKKLLLKDLRHTKEKMENGDRKGHAG